MLKLVPTDAVLVPDTATRVFQGIIFDVYQWPQKLFDGRMVTFEMLRRPDTVSVIGIVDDTLIVLQDEQPHSGMKRSFPGGRVDPGEDTQTAAKREMLEETGYEFDNWRLIKVWQPQTKIEQFVYLYLAWDGRKTADLHLDGGEKIVVERLTLQAVQQLVSDRAGYLGEDADIFENLKDISELLTLSEFKGQTVDRSLLDKI